MGRGRPRIQPAASARCPIWFHAKIGRTWLVKLVRGNPKMVRPQLSLKDNQGQSKIINNYIDSGIQFTNDWIYIV